MAPNLKRTHSPSLTSNTPAKRQKKHHSTDTTNRPGEDISPSLSEPVAEDALPRTTSHPSSPPRPVISSPSNDDEANDTDAGPYRAINMTTIREQSSYGSFIQRSASERPFPTGARPTTHGVATAADGLERGLSNLSAPPLQPPASTDDSQIHSSLSVSLSGSDNIVGPETSRAVQRGGVTAPPDQQRHTGPFAARMNVTRSQQSLSPALVDFGIPEPYRPFSLVDSQSSLSDGSIDEYNCEASLSESPDLANFLPAQHRVTGMYSDLLGDSYEPPSSINSRSSDRRIDGYRGQTTLPESPSLAPRGVPWSPQPIAASVASPLSPQQRGPSPRPRFVNDADRFLLPGRNSQGNSDVPEAPIRPSIQARSLSEGVGPPETYSAIIHHRPLAGRRPNASSSGGSANQYNHRVTPGLLPSLAPSGVLESRKHDVTSLESPSLHQEPTDVHSLFSPPLDPLPDATTSSRSPAPPASISTTRVTLPNQPQEPPGRVDSELPYPGDGSRRIAPDERHDPSPVVAPCSLPESPNQIITFAESEPQGGSTNGIMWEVLR